MEKETLIKYIQDNSPFHQFTNLNAHSIEQLHSIRKEIDSQNQSSEIETKTTD